MCGIGPAPGRIRTSREGDGTRQPRPQQGQPSSRRGVVGLSDRAHKKTAFQPSGEGPASISQEAISPPPGSGPTHPDCPPRVSAATAVRRLLSCRPISNPHGFDRGKEQFSDRLDGAPHPFRHAPTTSAASGDRPTGGATGRHDIADLKPWALRFRLSAPRGHTPVPRKAADGCHDSLGFRAHSPLPPYIRYSETDKGFAFARESAATAHLHRTSRLAGIIPVTTGGDVGLLAVPCLPGGPSARPARQKRPLRRLATRRSHH